VVCGDPDQVDLPPSTVSGLADAVRRLEGLPEIAVQRFSAADVVRDPLVGRIVLAYAKPDTPQTPAIAPHRATARVAPRDATPASGKTSLTVDLAIDSSDWAERLPGIEARVERAAQAAWNVVGDGLGEDAAVAILLADDLTLADLNRRFRGIDKPTNVLSFEPEGDFPGMDDEPRHIGDIAIAYETVSREAIDQDKTLEQHLCHMIVHGILHLLGYDHQVSDEQHRMEALERAILADLGVPDPFDTETE
jgi:probable rRNA maturation factor